MSDIKVNLKVSENSVEKNLSLDEPIDFSETLIIYGNKPTVDIPIVIIYQ